MGYLFDNYPFGTPAVECPPLYPYGMVVEWERRDPYVFLKPEDLIALSIKDAVPDVEEWQWSAIRPEKLPRHGRPREPGRIVFRFRTTARRLQGYNGLNTVGVEIRIRRIIFLNPPD